MLGCLYHSTYQWQASENAFRIALLHNPHDAQINYWYSLVLRSMGRVHEAFQYSSKAVALGPLHPIMLGGHILNCLYIGRFDLARASIDNGRGLFDGSFSYQYANAYHHMYQADYEKAVTNFQQALLLNPADRGHVPVLLYCEAKRGNRKPAFDFLHQQPVHLPSSALGVRQGELCPFGRFPNKIDPFPNIRHVAACHLCMTSQTPLLCSLLP